MVVRPLCDSRGSQRSCVRTDRVSDRSNVSTHDISTQCDDIPVIDEEIQCDIQTSYAVDSSTQTVNSNSSVDGNTQTDLIWNLDLLSTYIMGNLYQTKDVDVQDIMHKFVMEVQAMTIATTDLYKAVYNDPKLHDVGIHEILKWCHVIEPYHIHDEAMEPSLDDDSLDSSCCPDDVTFNGEY